MGPRGRGGGRGGAGSRRGGFKRSAADNTYPDAWQSNGQ